MKTYLLLVLVIAVFGVLLKATEEIDDREYTSLRDAIHNALDTEEEIVDRDLDVEKRTSRRGGRCFKKVCRRRNGKRVCRSKSYPCHHG